ncbi:MULTISPECIES: TfoX/Sxy family protein [unclassified Leucobacter]|uniref:TfoX/Sxy family protein n=1 Tax=unclassified Leucobacter TaxID=2621730 RepID=UPI000621BE95|nr:TfoX/Sxy family protein [Leucobacter sp. Ag1]KKI20291.1 hypothetical protein XM48_08145 [Leucobacter sp. Ag1]
MQMPKASEDQKQRFRDLIAEVGASAPEVEVKPMFGQLGAFVNGNMFAGLFGPDLGVKLAEPDAAVLAASGGGPFGPVERPMGGYLTLPADADAAEWIGRALAHVATLPPKAPKPSRAKR